MSAEPGPLVACRGCGGRVRRYAVRCPQCGTQEPGLRPLLDVLLPYALVATAVAWVVWTVLAI